jgi:hypothetical protein
MKGRPAPMGGEPPSPLGGDIYRVSYVTKRGQTHSELFRQRAAALSLAAWVLDEGGIPRVHRTRIESWQEVPACPFCAMALALHDHGQ